jgi:hypothetical protein
MGSILTWLETASSWHKLRELGQSSLVRSPAIFAASQVERLKKSPIPE